MKIHYLQHVAFEGLGYIESWIADNRHQLTGTRFFEPDHELPPPEDVDAVVVMGGPMNVDEEHIYPWLKQEKEWILSCISAGKKVLGICLGAQLIAACLGAKVIRAPHEEIGWFPVLPTQASQKFSGFYELFRQSPTVFHWHGDQFEIPKGCENLLDTAANTNQAFMYQDNALGLQFHLEVEPTNVLKMIEMCGTELDSSAYVQGAPELISGTAHCMANIILLSKLLDWFFKL